MPPDAALLATNQAFYDAFREYDLDAMEQLWDDEAEIACMHPGWPILHGRDEVLASWREIFGDGDRFDVRCASPVAVPLGANAALVTCIEVLPEGQLAATNVYVRKGGMWRIVHHQAGPTQTVPTPPVSDDAWN